MTVVVWKQIKPKKLDAEAMQKVLTEEMSKVAKEIEKDFQSTVATWETNVKFETIMELKQKGPSVLVGTDNEVYKFVDQGTRVRRALMTSNFSPKTAPNVIGSRRGKGGLLFVSKKINRPGIKARNFSKNIQKKWQPIFKRRMEKGMKKASQRSGHAI